MSILQKIKIFTGLVKQSSYVKSYFEKSNIRSSIYLFVVIVLEIWMILSVIYNQFFGAQPRSIDWVIEHVSCYSALLISCLLMFINAVRSIKRKTFNRKIDKIINITFSVVSILFGMYISYLDYLKGEQFITLFTMVLFIFCFIIWKPVYSILFLTISFSVFYYFCDRAIPASYATRVNLLIIWIAILMSAINSYHQKIREAQKDESLEKANDILLKLSISDEVTGMANMNYFRARALEKLHDKSVDISEMLFLFLDVEHFKSFNEKYGFIEGNEFLRKLGNKIEEVFSDSITARFSNDNFLVFTKDSNISEKLEEIRKEIKKCGCGLTMDLKTGAYRPENRDCLPIVACDHARYACTFIKKKYEKNFCEFSSDMNHDFYRKQYIINNIDKALENGYIKIYYQPLVNAANGVLTGLEALARWDDPDFGFLLPGVFISTLEEYHQIHKLDMYVLNKVCLDIVEQKNSGKIILPVSLNFSRLDFDVLDLVSEVEQTLKKYEVKKEFIHVEITESALTENDSHLQRALATFRKSGYSLWLDDFGSGYSGLNVLKEYDFDVMKIDMKFLHNFGANEKSKSILKNIVTMAKDIGMKTLTEGVETEIARDFLRDIGCEKLQGYLFGKPMTKQELREKIERGEYTIS